MIFPTPQVYECTDGIYKLKNKYDTDDLYSMWTALKNGNEDISYISNLIFFEDEYEIVIDDKGISISSSCDTGKFRAITTLRQLIYESDELSYCRIKDFPNFKKRAYMLEVSVRIPRMSTLKSFVDKLNKLDPSLGISIEESYRMNFKQFVLETLELAKAEAAA
ncbi:MAG: hypothetical protein IKV88_07220, partial [Clostridia bacterium]|nr:hypothetical protein [Clostridia bacterium]